MIRNKPCVLWFTGLSGAGKTTLVRELAVVLKDRDVPCRSLDGDDLRQTLNADLGFSAEDRMENMRRVAEVAKLFLDEGYIALVALISPLRRQRAAVRSLFEQGRFVEIFVDAPLSVCEERDPKGLYRRARAREIENFTGVDDSYEPPENPDLHLQTHRESPSTLVKTVITYLEDNELLLPN
ncbi:MAG: adenylyl-sulfate kinase [Gammaproteobacteria bacterium]|nr:adenylyl-sulfate kinase [Gammaproteobacteria bacterium]